MENEVISKIKTEIERLKAKYWKDMHKSNHEGLASGYKIEAYNELLSFLSTLESENPINPDDAMKELNEKIALVKQRGTWDGVDVDKYMDEVRGREPEKPKDLEEAAKEYTDGKSWAKENYLTPYIREAFIAGAKWQKEQDDKELSDLLTIAHLQGAEQMKEQMLKDGNVILAEEDFEAEKEKSTEWGYNLCKEQMMKDAVEGKIAERIQGKLYARCQVPETMKAEFGDKVRIIIVKED